MSQFELVTRFKPAGDQPEAIRQMIEGIEAGLSGTYRSLPLGPHADTDSLVYEI